MIDAGLHAASTTAEVSGSRSGGCAESVQVRHRGVYVACQDEATRWLKVIRCSKGMLEGVFRGQGRRCAWDPAAFEEI